MTIALIMPLLLTALLLAIIVIDLRQQIIPDILNAALALLGVAALYLNPDANYLAHGFCALMLGGIGAMLAGPYSKWRDRDMLGWGDVKFLTAAGLWLLPVQIGWFLMIAGLFGVVGSLAYKRFTGREETPFAPALCVALWVLVLFN